MITSVSLFPRPALAAAPTPNPPAAPPPAPAGDRVQISSGRSQVKVTAGMTAGTAAIFAAPAALGAAFGPLGALVGVVAETAAAYKMTGGMNVGRGAIVTTALVGSAVSGIAGLAGGWTGAAVVGGLGAALGAYYSFKK